MTVVGVMICADINRICTMLCSGYNEHEVGQRFSGKGLCGFFQKPYQLEELRLCLQKALETDPTGPAFGTRYEKNLAYGAPSIMNEAFTSPIIRARQLTRTYRLGQVEIAAVDHIDLDILPGQMVVLKGNSGSGKSTLLSLLGGLDQPTEGELHVAGRDLRKASPAELTHYRRSSVGIIFQSFNLLPTLTVLENTCLPALLAGEPSTRVKARALELLDWLNLSSRLQHPPSHLSGGEMQRTAIARALINDPAIILADEPTGNLDSRNGEIVMELLWELNRKLGRTVIVATHSTLADRYAGLSLFLKDGVIAEYS